jgi:hypothetical protein
MSFSHLAASTIEFSGPSWLGAALVPVLVMVWWCFGAMFLPKEREAEGTWERLPLRMAIGLAITTALVSTVALCRVNYQTLMGIVPLVWIGIYRLRGIRAMPGNSGPITLRAWVTLAVMTILVIFGTWLGLPLENAEGYLVQANDDLGYFAMVAKSLPESGVASVWSATLGPMCRDSGENKDVWYHWGPIWQVVGLSRVTGLSETIVLQRLLAPALNVVLVLLAGRFVRSATGWGIGRSLFWGVLSLIAVSLPLMSEPVLAVRWLPGDLNSHLHPSLAYQFSYKFEAVLVLAALSEWMGKRTWLAAMLLYMAGVSAPHTVAAAGLTGAGLVLAGILSRRTLLIGVGASIVGLVIFSWGSINFGFGVNLPKMADSPFIDLSSSVLIRNATRGFQGVLIGLVLALPILPGLWFWTRRTRSEQEQSLGWVAVAALVGGYLAYYVLLPEGDRAHFTMFTHAILVVPIGFWGLLGLVGSSAGFKRVIFSFLVAWVSAAGLYELRGLNRMQSLSPLHSKEVAPLKELLGDSLWGYFSKSERNWWIPKEATLASALESRCIRLNEIPKLDIESDAAQFYGSGRIYSIAPKIAGETDIQWSLRLAERLGIRYLIETDSMTCPDGMRPSVREVMRTEKIRVFEIRKAHGD